MTFGFSLTQSATVSIKVYDAMGRELSQVPPQSFEMGYRTIAWDAVINSSSKFIPSGTYYLKLTATDADGGRKVATTKNGGVLMIKYLMILLLLVSPMVAQTSQMGVLNIQTAMTSADIASFGRITPYKTQSIGNALINPASIGGIFNQMMVSNYQLSSQFDYRHFTLVFPYGDLVYGISYGTNITSDLPETAFRNGVVYDIGSFSSGFDVLNLSLGQKINESFFFIDHFNYGFALNMLTQVIGTSRRSPAYGLDFGLIATSFFDDFWLDRVDVGFSVINAVSTPLPSWTYDSSVGTSKEQQVERQIYTGAKFDLFNYTTAIHTGAYTQGFSLRDLMFGMDFQVSHGLNLRFSTTYDMLQGQEFVYNFGSGVMLNALPDLAVVFTICLWIIITPCIHFQELMIRPTLLV